MERERPDGVRWPIPFGNSAGGPELLLAGTVSKRRSPKSPRSEAMGEACSEPMGEDLREPELAPPSSDAAQVLRARSAEKWRGSGSPWGDVAQALRARSADKWRGSEPRDLIDRSTSWAAMLSADVELMVAQSAFVWSLAESNNFLIPFFFC